MNRPFSAADAGTRPSSPDEVSSPDPEGERFSLDGQAFDLPTLDALARALHRTGGLTPGCVYWRGVPLKPDPSELARRFVASSYAHLPDVLEAGVGPGGARLVKEFDLDELAAALEPLFAAAVTRSSAVRPLLVVRERLSADEIIALGGNLPEPAVVPEATCSSAVDDGSSSTAWPESHVDILYRLYPTLGTDAVLEAIAALEDGLPAWRPSQVHVKARNEGLTRESGFMFGPWSAEEDAVVRRAYPIGGSAGVFAELEGRRTRGAISARAATLGVVLAKGKREWTDEESVILASTYPTQGARAVVRALKGTRSINAVRMRAKDMGVCAKSPSRPWSDAEIEVLRAVYPERGWRGAVEALEDRSPWAVRTMASTLGIKAQPADASPPTPDTARPAARIPGGQQRIVKSRRPAGA